jgi:hypothetical protein
MNFSIGLWKCSDSVLFVVFHLIMNPIARIFIEGDVLNVHCWLYYSDVLKNRYP